MVFAVSVVNANGHRQWRARLVCRNVCDDKGAVEVCAVVNGLKHFASADNVISVITRAARCCDRRHRRARTLDDNPRLV